MNRILVLLVSGLFLASCSGDESLAAYGAGGAWRLAEIDGVDFPATATISFGEDGAVTGRAPCNRYSTRQTAPYPWFELGPIAATRMACPDLTAETAFFEALEAMSIAEVSGETLILSNEEKRSMVFMRLPPSD